jgi:hypothetical protein
MFQPDNFEPIAQGQALIRDALIIPKELIQEMNIDQSSGTPL